MSLLNDFRAVETRAELPAFLLAHGLNRRMCEVGVRFGHHLEALLRAEPELLIGVDLWHDDGVPAHNDTGMNQRALDTAYQGAFAHFLRNPRVKLFRGYSAGAAECVPDAWLDFCYIDADHTEAGALDDLNRWWRKVRQGGILAGHDYVEADSKNGVPFGVVRAVAKFRAAKHIPDACVPATAHGYRSWMILKLEGE
jgi:hypothetical protein